MSTAYEEAASRRPVRPFGATPLPDEDRNASWRDGFVAGAEWTFSEPLSDESIAEFWDWDISDSWVRERLAKRIRDAGYVVVRAKQASQGVEP